MRYPDGVGPATWLMPAATIANVLCGSPLFSSATHAAAERVVRDVLEGSPPEGRDAAADRRAVVNRYRGILRERRQL
jgi:hypothetical protein